MSRGGLLAKTFSATGAFGASRLDGTVLLFALLVSIATGILNTRRHPAVAR